MAYTEQQQQQPNGSGTLSEVAEIGGMDPGTETVDPAPPLPKSPKYRRVMAGMLRDDAEVREIAPGLVGS